jgi:beta-glucanase (GH16 family)
MRLEHRTLGWYGDFIDTGRWFEQAYGHYEARIAFPAGKGYWPAFWLLDGWDHSSTDELDTMEVCANPLGLNGGNDASLLHNTIHSTVQIGNDTRTSDLSLDWHVYGIDWRPGTVTFFLDGAPVWTYTGPAVPSSSMVVALNFGVGGGWCGAPDLTTPTSAEMLVDWVRVSP